MVSNEGDGLSIEVGCLGVVAECGVDEGGALYVFTGKSPARMKVLWWDRNGYGLVTLIASARHLGLDPAEYLRDLLCLLPTWPARDVLDLAPVNWAATVARPEVRASLARNPFRRISLSEPLDHPPREAVRRSQRQTRSAERVPRGNRAECLSFMETHEGHVRK